MGRVTRSAFPEGLRLQEPVHLLLQTFVVLEGVVAVRRLSTKDFCQIRASRVARRPVVCIPPPDFPSRGTVDVGVGIRCAIDIQRSLRVSVSQQMMQPSRLQFASLHGGSSSLIFDLEIQSSTSLGRCDQRPLLHGELGGLVRGRSVGAHDFFGPSEHIDERRRVLREGVATAR